MEHREESSFIPAALLILVTLFIGFVPIQSDPDLWFHLADGEYILNHGRVPQVDPFSFTKAGQLWVPHSWLFDVGTALSWHILGPRATEALMAVVFALTIVLSFNLLTARRVSPVWAMVFCVGLAVAAGNTRGVRPQVFTLLFCNLVIFLLVRHRYRPRPRLLIYFPLIFLLWAQLHSACIMGLIVTAVWLAGRIVEAFVAAGPRTGRRSRQSSSTGVEGHFRRELLIGLGALAVSAGAVLITPHHITHFQYIAHTMKLGELGRTAEWQVPRLLPIEVPDIYMYLLVAGIVVLLARRARQVGWAELGLCTGLIMLGLTGVRHIPLACIAAVPLVADTFARRETYGAHPSPKRKRGTRARTIGMTAALLVAALALLLAVWRYPTDIQARYAQAEPVKGAHALIQLDRPLRIFTTYNTGSYILWAAPGELQVFVDSRADVYGDELLADAYQAMQGRGWESLFQRWEVDGAVVQRWNPLSSILTGHNDWSLLAEDPCSLTFVCRGIR